MTDSSHPPGDPLKKADQEALNKAPPRHLTKSCISFYGGHYELLKFVSFLFTTTEQADAYAQRHAKWMNDIISGKYGESLTTVFGEKTPSPEHLHERARRGIGATESLHEHMELTLQMVYVRASDNFLTYITELLREIFKAKPETLKSNEILRLDVVLSFGSMDELTTHVIERKVNELAYQGLRELSSYLDQRLGLPLITSEKDLLRAVSIIERRNLIVHNRAVVNDRFVSRVQDHSYVTGDQLKITDDECVNELLFLVNLVCDLDKRAAVKFGLRLIDLMKYYRAGEAPWPEKAT